MANSVEIRESNPCDLPAIKSLYLYAFPDEELLPLVMDLLQDATVTTSFIGTVGSSIVGHGIFTSCTVAGMTSNVALLGPLAVTPTWQEQGIGSAIIRNGLQKLGIEGVSHVYVLGDPAYYNRFGFVPEANVAPPYPLPTQWRGAWQSMSLGNAEPLRQSELSVPQPWMRPALWAP